MKSTMSTIVLAAAATLSFYHEDGAPGVPSSTSSCWQLVDWGAGCGWGKEETTAVDQGWSVAHEVYNVFGDYPVDVTLTGNGCDGTVLNCVGSHSEYTLPSPDPNTPGQNIWISDTQCALPGQDVDALNGGDIAGAQLYAVLSKEGNTYGFNEDLGSLTNLGAQSAPAAATCDLFNDPETVCTPFWECVDSAASITSYFPGDATLASSLTTNPTVAPIESPGAC